MSHFTFELIKDTDNILAYRTPCIRSIYLYESLYLEGGEFGHGILKELSPINAKTPAQEGKEFKHNVF